MRSYRSNSNTSPSRASWIILLTLRIFNRFCTESTPLQISHFRIFLSRPPQFWIDRLPTHAFQSQDLSVPCRCCRFRRWFKQIQWLRLHPKYQWSCNAQQGNILSPISSLPWTDQRIFPLKVQWWCQILGTFLQTTSLHRSCHLDNSMSQYRDAYSS